MKKLSWFITTVSLIIVFSLLFVWTSSLFLSNKDKAEKHLKKYFDDFVVVVDFFSKTGNEIIPCSTNRDALFRRTGDKEVSDALRRLFRFRKFQLIGKNNSGVYFEYQGFGSECEKGLIFSSHKNEKPGMEYLTKLTPLSADDWYYYEADYNEWRAQNY